MKTKVNLEVILEDDRWQDSVDFDAIKVAEEIKDLAFLYVAKEVEHEVLALAKELNVNVCLSGDEEVRKLNREFRGKDAPTNVLSFANIDEEEFWDGLESGEEIRDLGDIILAFETLEKEAREKGISLYAHYVHLLVHDFLHLLGFDHVEDEDAEVMEELEIEILREFSIENPYKDEEF